MNWKKLFEPNWKKLVIFLILSFVIQSISGFFGLLAELGLTSVITNFLGSIFHPFSILLVILMKLLKVTYFTVSPFSRFLLNIISYILGILDFIYLYGVSCIIFQLYGKNKKKN